MSQPQLTASDEPTILWRGAVDARRHAGFDIAFGGLVTDAGLRLTEFDGAVTDSMNGLGVQPGLGLGGRVLTTGKAATVVDYVADRRISHDYDAPVRVEGLRAMAAVPILLGRSGGSSLGGSSIGGVLYGSVRQRHPIGDRALAQMESAAARVATELTIRREVERRVREADQEREVQHRLEIDRVRGVERQRLWAGHDRLRALAEHAGPLREELDAVANMLVGEAGEAGAEGSAVTLTPRERQTLAAVASGCTNAAAATVLGVGTETVKSHLGSIYRKLDVGSRTEAVAAARRNGLVP